MTTTIQRWGALAALTALFCPATYGATVARHVNDERLRGTLEKLSEYGRDPGGGITRLGFSQAELDARAYVTDLMKSAGLAVRVDPAGNIFGRRPGTAQLPTLLFGSHIDSVPHGGAFDGSVGSLGAIEVIRALNDQHVKTRHPLEVVVWTDEEGPHFARGARMWRMPSSRSPSSACRIGSEARCRAPTIAPAGIVTLPWGEREASAAQESSGCCDGGPPCVHRHSAKRAVRLG